MHTGVSLYYAHGIIIVYSYDHEKSHLDTYIDLSICNFICINEISDR